MTDSFATERGFRLKGGHLRVSDVHFEQLHPHGQTVGSFDIVSRDLWGEMSQVLSFLVLKAQISHIWELNRQHPSIKNTALAHCVYSGLL